MSRLAFRLFLFLLLVAVLATGVVVWGLGEFKRPGPLAAEKTLVIPRGTGVEGIAGLLHEAGVLSGPLVFRIGARLSGADTGLRAGEYVIPARISPQQVIALLQSGKTVVRRLTVAEGLTTAQVISQLNATEGLQGLAVPAGGGALDEGGLLPETYHFSYGDKRSEMLSRMHKGQRETLAALWANRAGGLPFKTPDEALVLASIVEKETALASERGIIAAVFINRLNRGMRLQSDPTVVYGLTGGRGPLSRPLTRVDLKRPTAFNTYLIDRLPPTPICNPGRASLAAVLNPANSDALYFVADGSGGHVFARTLAEHNRNVANWRRFQRQQRNKN